MTGARRQDHGALDLLLGVDVEGYSYCEVRPRASGAEVGDGGGEDVGEAVHDTGEDDIAAQGAAGGGDERGAARVLLQAMDVEGASSEPLAAEVGDGGLTGPAGNEVRVDGVDGDQPGQQAAGVRVEGFGSRGGLGGLGEHEGLPEFCPRPGSRAGW
ncbi:hypothetical protein [Streptomyces sp. NPDC048710]|uniref:hypothetical protein n=1 Tax=unclassified Streptomyces TaxID=2593676 RepID=UPI0037108D3F